MNTLRPIFTLAGLATILLVGASTLERASARDEAHFYKTELSDIFYEEHVEVEGTTYRVAGGIVRDADGATTTTSAVYEALRLAYAKALARRAPVAALPGNDPQELRRLAGLLEKLESDMKSLQKTNAERAYTGSALYPLAFIRAMADAEEARAAFLAEGSNAALERYLRARRTALSAYRSDAQDYVAGFDALVPHSSKYFSRGDQLVTYEDMRTALQGLAAAARGATEREYAQERCVRGVVAACEPFALAPTLPPRTARVDLTSQQIRFSSEVSNILRIGIAPSAPELEEETLFVVLAQNKCAIGNSAPALYRVRSADSTLDGLPYRKVHFVGDMRFIESRSLPAVPFYKYFADRGVHYLLTSPLLHYVCPDFSDDLASVYLVDSVFGLARRTPLSREAPPGAAEAFERLEHTFVRGTTLTKPAQQAGAQEYLARAVDLADKGLLRKEVAEEIYDLRLQAQYGTAGWSDTLHYFLETDDANVRILKKGVPVDLEAAYLFFFRSPVLFLYMTNNPSVSEGFSIPGTAAGAAERNPYVYYSDFYTDARLRAQVRHDVPIYRDVHQRPADAPIEDLFE